MITIIGITFLALELIGVIALTAVEPNEFYRKLTSKIFSNI